MEARGLRNQPHLLRSVFLLRIYEHKTATPETPEVIGEAQIQYTMEELGGDQVIILL